ncbi:glycoside hydrolase/deacetylase [Lichtheimia hyalospora FSU 10163]|nr:glycoside hydrolase/deacetylase [Lichtheimia hyalospora FSU 10163]
MTCVAQAQFQFKDTYPTIKSIPAIKPEWRDLIANASITNAPIRTRTPDGNVDMSTVTDDPYCTWSFDRCIAEDDLYTCPTSQYSVTFDDGPSEFSPKLYDYLKSINVKTTFFMVGGQVLTHPDLVKRAYDDGHEIAMHTWSHTAMTTQSNEEIVAELKWNEQVIREVLGVSPRFFRPPFGNIDNRVRDIAKALGFVPVMWTHDTNDWGMTAPGSTFDVQWISNNITEWGQKNTTEGGVSLSHDLYNRTVDAALEYIPVFQNFYDLTAVGQCNNAAPYKESNSTNSSKDGVSPSGDESAAAALMATPSWIFLLFTMILSRLL